MRPKPFHSYDPSSKHPVLGRRRARRRLERRPHPDTVPPLTVSDVVHKMHAKFDGRPIRDFVPLFVERNAQSEFAKLGG
jgi:hypothetical protein